MRPLFKALRYAAAIVSVVLASAHPTFAQVTTGTLSGAAVDESGGVLPGADVTAVHQPTGTRYTAISDSIGRFIMVNVRAGGPYTVSAKLTGFKTQEQSGVFVKLGEDRSVEFRLGLETVTETVTVTAEASSIISSSATGPVSNVAQETIENLPTVTRGLEDFARLSPYFNNSGGGDGSGAATLSVAGRNNRYNNVQIDGAVNNDLFGLADSGTPGGQTETQPISLDAIQEIQLLVAPYDVRQGGFTGGGLNAITRGGSNSFSGTAYYFFRDEGLVGDGPDERPIATFNDKQFGASIGGPIRKDKLFFFLNADLTRKDTPSGFSADGSSGQNFGHTADVERVRSIAQARYGYDPGGLGEFIKNTESSKVFGRLDFNLSDDHRLTLRHNFIKASSDIGFPTSRRFFFPDLFYHIRDTTNSSVVQLNSNFGAGKVNELRLTFQRVRDNRDGDTRFPFVQVDLPDGTDVRFGRENFSTANALDQDIIELTDDFTWSRGKHLLTIGTHNEFFKFRNLFIRDNFGNYRFSSIANFEAGIAQSFDHSFSTTGDPQQPARFKVQQLGFYAGDLWRLTSDFTLNLGVRLDLPIFPDKPTANPNAAAIFGFATDVAPSPAMFSPRAGFNWNLGGEAKQQLRGGAGIFAGRTPYVWLSNQYGNTGIEFRRVSLGFNARNQVAFVVNPDAQPTSIGSAATNEVDVVDPDYKFPSVARGNLAYDRELGFWGLVGSVEAFYAKVINDIDYQNLNLVQVGSRPDGRPLFARTRDRAFSDVILLLNTDKGSQWTVSGKLERPFLSGLYFMASYIYGESKSVSDGGSSQAASNWGNAYTTGDPNHVPESTSRFDPGHRINAAVSKDFKLGKVDVVASLFYNGQSGRPYSFTFNSDWNGDLRFTNDLMYVPRDASEVIVRNGTWDQLNAYIEADPGLRAHRGEVIPKSAARGPWTNSMDLRVAVGVPVRKLKLQVTGDVLNVLNLLSKDWGVVDFATFADLNPVRVSLDTATGRMVYDIATLTAPTFTGNLPGRDPQGFDRDDLRSRWQAQLGLRVRF